MVSVRETEPCCARAISAEVARGIGRFVISPWHPFMIPVKPTIVELEMDKLEEILQRLEAKELDADDYETIKAVIGSYVYLVNVVGDKDTTIRRLRQMLFGAKTEKTSAVIGGLKVADGVSPEAEAATGPMPTPAPRRSRCVTSRSGRAILARSARTARSTTPAVQACWCGWWARRPWQPWCIISRSCVAIFAAGSLPPSCQQAWMQRRSTTLPWAA